MRSLFIALTILVTCKLAVALEPLYIIQAHDDYVNVNGKKVSSIAVVISELEKLNSPNEVYVHAHVCLNAKRLNQLIDSLLPAYKPHLSTYGSQEDDDCH